MFREAREQVHREKTTGEETLEHWAMGKCVMADDPRLVVAPTPQAPAAKPPKAATAPPQPPVPPSQAEPPLRLGKSFDQGEPLCNDKFGFRLLLDETKDGSCVIHYTPGRPIIITAWLFHGPNENHSRHRWPAQLVLDTGADLTMIRPQVLAKAGVDLTRPVGSGTISGVGGKTTASYFIVDSIVVGTSDALRVRVAAYDIAGSNSDGVLGNDILRQFKISIDSAAGIVTLTPRLRVKR